MSDEQILFLYKAFKCQGENGFAGDGFALTSASGILLKPDTAWLERGPGERSVRGSAWGSAGCRGISVQASEERVCSKRRELAAPDFCPSDTLPSGSVLGRAYQGRQSSLSLGWLLYYGGARSEEKQGQAQGG